MGYANLLNAGYMPRLIERQIEEGLEDFGAVCIEGPKYCGKTWAAQAFSNSEVNLMDPAGNFQNLEVALMDPQAVLQGEYPRLIDEWQEAPLLWDGVRNAVDRSGKKSKYVLTGSSVPRQLKPKHSGVGRIERIRMRPMTLYESGESNGAVSLAALFEGEKPSAAAPESSLEAFCELVVRGGWPASLGMRSRRAAKIARNYVEELCRDDMSRVDGVRRDPGKAARLLHSLARNAEQSTSTKTMIGDMTAIGDEGRLAPDTVTDYLGALKKMYIVEEIGPWAPNLRSPIRINKRPKYHFVDPSIPAAVLKTSASALRSDLETLGFLFESMCVRDILSYAQVNDGNVFFYRDQVGLEADAIVESADGRWAGIEVKLGHNKADDAARSLRALRDKIVASGGAEPAFLAVVEGIGSYAYVREDGVFVIPILTLTA